MPRLSAQKGLLQSLDAMLHVAANVGRRLMLVRASERHVALSGPACVVLPCARFRRAEHDAVGQREVRTAARFTSASVDGCMVAYRSKLRLCWIGNACLLAIACRSKPRVCWIGNACLLA